MSAKPYTLEVDGEEVIISRVNIDWDVNSMATFSSTLKQVKELRGFDRVQISRDDVVIFDGRQERPKIQFGAQGRKPMPISGFDWTKKLSDLPTVSQSIVDSSTATALAAILSETDFAVSIIGTFSYISELQNWDESHELLTTIPTYNNCSIEYDLNGIEIQDEFFDDVFPITDFGLSGTNNCFFYDGTTERYYIFVRHGTNIYYYHSPDGTTWTSVNPVIASNTIAWSVMWRGAKVYLFIYDGIGTDFYRGTINDGTGTITFVEIAGNFMAGQLRFGPVYDNDSHLWIVEASATGTAWESTDDGLNWNNRFSAAANHTLWGVMPEGTDGDMVSIVVDVPNDDIEEWLWDRSAGTHTFVARIRATANDIDSLDAAMNDNWAIVIAWTDGATSYHAYRAASATWTVASLSLNPNNDFITVSCDGGLSSYVFLNSTAGFRALKFTLGVLDTTFSETVPWDDSGNKVGGTRCWGQDGILAGGFGCATDAANDGWFYLFDPTGIRLNNGDATGDFTTDTVNASGTMTSWGTLTASGVGIFNGIDVLWDILRAADSVVLADDQTAAFDLDIAGVDPSETAIKIQGFLVDSGTDPYVYEFDITEKIDSVSIDTDYEDAYTGVKKLADIAGAEFYVTFDGTTYTLVFTPRRGEDKSNYVILKAASSSRRPDVKPNIKVLTKEFDWSSYANIVRVVGGEDADGNRIIATVRDNEEIDAHDGTEYWFILRDGDVPTVGMARQRAYQELSQRNSVVIRIGIEFIDKEASGQIEIGDSAMIYADWDEEGLEIAESLRFVKLHRGSGPGGEKVKGSLSNKLKYAQYWNYLRVTDDHGRWITV